MLSANGYPALVLNADFRPLSYFPLSLWSWQEAVKAAFLGRVNIVSEYEEVVHSPSFAMNLPSVISLKDYVHLDRRPAFTRFNVFLRDRFRCQYCGVLIEAKEITCDHVIPRSRGGQTTWENVVAACHRCNVKKGDRLPEEVGMRLFLPPARPSHLPTLSAPRYPQGIPDSWRAYLGIEKAV